MSAGPIETARLKLIASTLEKTRAQIGNMTPAEKAQLSPDWLERLRIATTDDPWVIGFDLVDKVAGTPLGACGFKGPPDADGIVEIAYGIAPEHQNKGYATEAAAALVQFARADAQVRTIRAHTIESANASTRVLVKCGFQPVGQVVDPEDGPVWRWEIRITR